MHSHSTLPAGVHARIARCPMPNAGVVSMVVSPVARRRNLLLCAFPSRSLKFASRTKGIPAGAVFEFLFPSGLLRKTAFGSSSGGGAEQFWQTDEIVGGHHQREFEAQTPASTQHGPGESANGLGPA